MNKRLFFASLIAIFLGLVCSGKTYASEASILKKWAETNYYDCIVNDGAMTETIEVYDDNGKLAHSGKVIETAVSKTGSKLLPSYGFGGTTAGKTLNCREVTYGTKYGMKGILNYGNASYSINWSKDVGARDTLLVDSLKYNAQERADGGGSFTINAYRQTEICSYAMFYSNCSDSSSETSSSVITATRNSDGTMTYTRGSGNFWNDVKVNLKNGKITVKVDGSILVGCTGGGEKTLSLRANLDTMYSDLESELANISWTETCTTASDYSSTTSTSTYTFGVSNKVVDSSETSQYTYPTDKSGTANKSIKAITGDTSKGLSNTERWQLYDYYIDKVVASAGAAANKKTCSPSSTTNLTEVKMLDASDNTFKTCYINLNGHSASEYSINAPNLGGTKIETTTLQDAIDWMNSVNTSTLDVNELTAVTSSDDPYGEESETETSTDSEVTCLSSGAAESLGWIVCPVLTLANNFFSWFYESALEPALQVSPQLFTGSGEQTQTEGWKVFRDIANVLFIIVLLAVIFSQLTGVGIDNYGIKKILPKMIVAAVLINLSYWICVALVDVSNILGNAFQDMFEAISVDASGATTGGINIGASLGATGLSALAIFGAVFAGIWAVVGSEGLQGLALMLVITAISIIVSVIFLFILLAARQAAIVVLTVLSPIAIVCFMLPNTKGIFSKWIKFFWSLLMVYPIVGLLVGGGNYMSKLLLVTMSDTWAGAFTAMIVGIVPIFFIPTVLRKSLAMAGDIGTRIQDMGRRTGGRLGGNLNKAVRSSERWRNAQDDWGRMRRVRAAERTRKSLSQRQEELRANGGDLSDRQRRRLAQSEGILVREQSQTAAERNLVNGGYDARIAAISSEAENQQTKDVESMLMNGGITEAGVLLTSEAARAGEKSVNANSMKEMEAFHKGALARYASATTDEERSTALAQIRAAQNIMSKNDKGRTAVAKNLSAAVGRATTESEVSGARMAANHLMSQYGDLYKSKNRGANEMITNLATGSDNLDEIKTKINDQTYDKFGTSKYTEETLAGADDSAIDKLYASMGAMSSKEREDLQRTAAGALSNSNISVKPEVAEKLSNIVNYGTGGAQPSVVTASVGGQGGQTGQDQVFNVREADAQAAADEIDFVSHLSTVSDNGLDSLYGNTDFRSTLSDAANQALENEYNRRTTPSSSSTPRTTPRTTPNSNSTTNSTPPRPNA